VWEKFKGLVLTLKPDTVYYLSEPHPLKRPPLGLRLTFYHGGDIYVFTDFADGGVLRKTGIHVASSNNRIRAEIREADIRDFLSSELGEVKLVSLPPFMY